MMNKMKKVFAVSLLSTVMASANAAETCTPNMDSFMFFADASGSMMQEAKGQDVRKSEIAKSLVRDIGKQLMVNASLPVALYALAPYAELVPTSTQTSEAFTQAVDQTFNTQMEVFGRPTWMGERAKARLSSKMDGVGAAILITDGGFTGELNDPIETVKAFKEINPDARLYVISLAETDAEKSQAVALAKVAGTMLIDGFVLANDAQTLTAFVNENLLNDCSSIIEIKGIRFAFDSARVSKDSHRVLMKSWEAVKARLDNKTLHIVGWTDATGSVAYNQKLSERRANAVKTWFVEQGLEANRITTQGRGISTKYPNNTSKGRAANRRIDIELGS